MSELEKKEIYACALSLPNQDRPLCEDWVDEIARHVIANPKDKIYLIGHSLGATAILRYLESPLAKKIAGTILVSGPVKTTGNEIIENFLTKSFDFKKIKSKIGKALVIHGNNDPRVPLEHAKFLSEKLNCKLTIIKNGGHLNGSSGWHSLPQVLEGLLQMLSVKELESLKETALLSKVPGLLKSLKKSQKEAKQGKTITLEELS